MNRTIVHAPLHFQGLGIPSVYISQGIAHIKALLDAPPLKGITGSLLTCLVEDLKLEIGLSRHFLQRDYKCFKQAMTQFWWMCTWEFPHTGCIWIEDPLQDLPLCRINDVHLTESFLREVAVGKLLRHLNHCCLFFQAQNCEKRITNNQKGMEGGVRLWVTNIL